MTSPINHFTEIFNGNAVQHTPEFGDRYYIKNVIILSTDGQDVTAVEMDIPRQKDLLVRQPNNAAGETEIIPITPTADFRPYVKLVVHLNSIKQFSQLSVCLSNVSESYRQMTTFYFYFQ